MCASVCRYACLCASFTPKNHHIEACTSFTFMSRLQNGCRAAESSHACLILFPPCLKCITLLSSLLLISCCLTPPCSGRPRHSELTLTPVYAHTHADVLLWSWGARDPGPPLLPPVSNSVSSYLFVFVFISCVCLHVVRLSLRFACVAGPGRGGGEFFGTPS